MKEKRKKPEWKRKEGVRNHNSQKKNRDKEVLVKNVYMMSYKNPNKIGLKKKNLWAYISRWNGSLMYSLIQNFKQCHWGWIFLSSFLSFCVLCLHSIRVKLTARLPPPNTSSWTTWIKHYAKEKTYSTAFLLFSQKYNRCICSSWMRCYPWIK